jgi:hypothetical protein
MALDMRRQAPVSRRLQKGNGQQKAKKLMRKKGERPKLAAVNAYNLDYLREKFN